MEKKFILVFFLFTALCLPQANQAGSKSLGDNLLGTGLSVTIGGGFVLTGTFTAIPGERLDQFITRIFTQGKAERLASITNSQQKQLILTELDKYAKRGIRLKRSNGQILNIDLEKFHITGDFANNPYLQHDDFIFFPVFNPEMHFISVSGAVVREGKFQFVEGDKLQDILLLAHGFDPAYERIDHIYISRLNEDGSAETLLNFSVQDNPPLRLGDRVLVSAHRNDKKDFRIRIDGEVNKPGFIPVTKGTTTIREVIAKAGGFTDKADLRRAELLRGANVFKSTYFTEEFESLLMSRMAYITPEDSLTFIGDNKLRVTRANGTIDFEKFQSDTSIGNFLVQDGDYLFIPEKVDLVYVFGHVNNPGYIPYQDNKGYGYYLQQAGGIGQNPKSEIYVIRGKTRSWEVIDPEHPPVIEAGDYIWVPKEPARTFEYYLSRINAVAAVVTAAATIVLLIVQLGK